MSGFYDTPIQARCLPQTVEALPEEHNERFVDIYAYSEGAIRVNMQYAKNGISSAIPTAYVREEAAKRLMEAKKLLPKGYTFEIFDAWRPYEVQLALFCAYRDSLSRQYPAGITAEELDAKTCEFVSFPDKSKMISYVHSSGGAVDLTIVDEKGMPLDMGSEFDAFSENSYTAWYEKNGDNPEIRNNRRLLYNVLSACGFTNYPAEWWHYDFGDIFWAFYTGKNVLYRSIYEIKDVKKNG